MYNPPDIGHINKSNSSQIHSINSKKLANFDLTHPVDINTGVQNNHGNENMFYYMLEKMEELSINGCMEQISDGVNTKNGSKMLSGADTLKGSSSYIGAGYIYYACYYIITAFNEKNLILMERYYPLLVEAVIEHKRFSRNVVSQHKGR